MSESVAVLHMKHRYLRKISIFATFGSFLFGYDTGVINGSLSFMKLKSQLNLSPALEGFVTSSILIGAVVGALMGGYGADTYGRKLTLRILAIIFFFSTPACALSPNAYVMIAFRFILGIGVGGAAAVVPTYLAELAPKKVRGALVSQDLFMIAGGQLVAYIVNAILGNVFNNANIWRYMIACGTIPALVLLIGTLIIPETPRWLVAHGKVNDAIKVLSDTRELQEADLEINEIRENVEIEKNMGHATLKISRFHGFVGFL